MSYTLCIAYALLHIFTMPSTLLAPSSNGRQIHSSNGDRSPANRDRGPMPRRGVMSGSDRLILMMARLLGERALAALACEDVTELYLNPGEAFLRLDTHSGGRTLSDIPFTAARAEQFLNCVATYFGISLSTPQLHVQLPQKPFLGARLQGLLPPLVPFAAMSIRCHAPIIPLERYVQDGILTAAQYDAITALVTGHQSVVIAGGTRSGKTTLANAIIQEITYQFPSERLVILEDTSELQCAAEDAVAMRVPEGSSLADLVKWTLRTSPDRIIVGEVRDESALYLLDAWSTGHPGGIATVHATTAMGALDRLDRLARRAGAGPQPGLVASAVDAVLLIEGVGDKRRVRDIALVNGYAESGYELQFVN